MAFSLSAQTCLSASVRLRLKRLSAVLSLRPASRHSASNQSVAGLGLRHTVTTGQCLSSSCVITYSKVVHRLVTELLNVWAQLWSSQVTCKPHVQTYPTYCHYQRWWSRYQIILFGDRGICVWTACLRSLPGSVLVRSQTCTPEWPQNYKSDTLPLPTEPHISMYAES